MVAYIVCFAIVSVCIGLSLAMKKSLDQKVASEKVASEKVARLKQELAELQRRRDHADSERWRMACNLEVQIKYGIESAYQIKELQADNDSLRQRIKELESRDEYHDDDMSDEELWEEREAYYNR